MNGIILQLKQEILNQCFKKLIKCEKKMKTHYSSSMLHSVLNSLPALDFNLVICEHVEVKLKLLNRTL